MSGDWWLPDLRAGWWWSGGGCGMGWCKMDEGVKRYQLPIIKYINDGDMMYSMLTTVNNTVFYIWKFLRVHFQSPYHKKEKVSNQVWWQVLTRWSWGLLHNVYKYQIISCTPEPDTIALIAVNYTSMKHVSDITWWHSSVIPMNHGQLPGKENRWLLGMGGWVIASVVAKLKLREPRSHTEVGREPGEHGDLEPLWRQSLQTEETSHCALCYWILSQMSKGKGPLDLVEGRWLLTLARVFPWVVKTSAWSLWVDETPGH